MLHVHLLQFAGAVATPFNFRVASEGVFQPLGATELLPTGARLVVYGHTDSVGSDAFNMGLSEERAQTAAGLREAIHDALEDYERPRLVICGSLYLAGEVLALGTGEAVQTTPG